MTFLSDEGSNEGAGSEGSGEVLFSGRLWGLTRDERSVKIVGPQRITNDLFQSLRDRHVIVLAASSDDYSDALPFIVRPAGNLSVAGDSYHGQWEVVETECDNVVATCPDQEFANQVKDALVAQHQAEIA
jgi:hypothetical protein